MLKDTLKKDMITALKAGNKLDVSVLRFVISEIQYAEINKHSELTDEEIISVMQKEVKKRKDAIDLFRINNRIDIVADEEKQLEIIKQYLPKQLSTTEIEKIVDETIAATGSQSQMGQVIGMVMSKIKGKADGKLISDLVKRKLAK